MATQLNYHNKMNATATTSDKQTTDAATKDTVTKTAEPNETGPGPPVDLDNLFSFLSDLQTTEKKPNNVLDDIATQMEELVKGFKDDVSRCLFGNKM